MSVPTDKASALAQGLKAYSSTSPSPFIPSLDDEMRRLVSLYGKEAVRVSARENTKSKRGRKPDPDWSVLSTLIESDAELWLKGLDPTAKPRTNYAIAQAFAEANPGHSLPATHRRILRKLAKSRMFFMLVRAEQIGRSNYPSEAYIRTLEALSRSRPHPVWADLLETALAAIGLYCEREGDPDAALSFKEISDANERAARNALFPPPAATLGGLLGLGRGF